MRRLTLALLLTGCPATLPDEPPTPAGCGDAVLQGGEQCDDGEANSDTAPDACRSDCRPARCGDGVVDGAEDCDDGGLEAGDGCSAACRDEPLVPETEPNDDADGAQPLAGFVGSLPEGDVDCLAATVVEGGWLEATTTLDEACPGDVALALLRPDGGVVATAAPGSSGCTTLSGEDLPGARFLAAGTYVICASGFLDRAVPGYELRVEVGADSCELGAPFTPPEDPDGDGLPDRCDPDDDGDGVLDEDDNCPREPNGGGHRPLAPDDEGFLRDWLTVGSLEQPDGGAPCHPNDDERPGDDATAVAALGDFVQGQPWRYFHSRGRRVDLLDHYGGPTPREVYAMTWVRSETERAVSFAVGPDDGVRVWLGDAVVLENSDCQGTSVDRYTAEVTLLAGWNRVLLQVRDQGGGWGFFARFKDGEDPVLDLELSPVPQTWAPDQSDRDGDGIGDICDED